MEETLASYLSPESSSSIKSLVLPTKPVRITSALLGKANSAAGQAAIYISNQAAICSSKSSSSHRATQKQNVAYRAPPHKDWGHGKDTQPQTSKSKTDLRTFINSKKAAGEMILKPEGTGQ